MIPQTLGALFAFLGLVAPGLVFELTRERKRLHAPCSTFREASRVALASFSLILGAATIQAAAWKVFPGLSINLSEWLRNGGAYTQEHITRITGNLIFTTATACTLALIVAQAVSAIKRETASLSNGNPWQEALRSDRPRDSNAWAHVQLQDGTAFFGYVESWTLNEKSEERDILLYGTSMKRVKSTAASTDDADDIGLRWEKVVISASQISYIRVQYRDALGELVPSKRRKVELNVMEQVHEDLAATATGPTTDKLES
ncbi:DUF6338 family protein [Amycolatopsis japonica]|uniref:DUF6338 family protein n=1 Tax=Amycolatopsis japonica TaxID=208439 RepID=UPI0037FEF263